MSETKLTIEHVGPKNEVDCRMAQGPVMTFDGEGGSHGATPMQHLLAAVGACTLMDVAHILRKKRLVFANLAVEAKGTRADEGHPTPFTSIALEFRVEGNVPKEAFEQAVRLSFEKYCNVGATLRAGVQPTVVIREPTPSRAATVSE
ncbi:MAG: OsmC family protein [Thermoplasmatota archaeon]